MILVFRAANTYALSAATNLDYPAKKAKAWTLDHQQQAEIEVDVLALA